MRWRSSSWAVASRCEKRLARRLRLLVGGDFGRQGGVHSRQLGGAFFHAPLQLFVRLVQRLLGPLAVGHVPDVALDDAMIADIVDVADELHVDAPPVVRLERQILVADVALLLQLPEGHLARLDVAKQADFPEFLPHQFAARVAKQSEQIRVGVEDLPGIGVQDQDAVLRRLEEPAVARFGNVQRIDGLSVFGDVFDGEEDEFGAVPPLAEAAGVEQHRPPADAFKLVVYFKIVEVAVSRKDLLQQHPQARDVPLAVAQVVEEPALRLGGRDQESLIERPVRGPHSQVGVENQQGLADGLHDALGVIESVLRGPLDPPAVGNVMKDQHDPRETARRIADGGGAVVDGSLRPVAGDEDRASSQSDDQAAGQHFGHGVHDRQAGPFVDDVEDLGRRLSRGGGERPAGQRLGHGVQEAHPALGVGDEHRVANARQRDVEPVRLIELLFALRHGNNPSWASPSVPGRARIQAPSRNTSVILWKIADMFPLRQPGNSLFREARRRAQSATGCGSATARLSRRSISRARAAPHSASPSRS